MFSASIQPTGTTCHGLNTSGNVVAAAGGFPAARHINAAIWPRVSFASGEYVVGEVPVVMFSAYIHDTGSCCQGATTSTNGCGAEPRGEPSMRHKNAAAWPRVTESPGEKQVEDVSVVMSLSTIHCTALV